MECLDLPRLTSDSQIHYIPRCTKSLPITITLACVRHQNLPAREETQVDEGVISSRYPDLRARGSGGEREC